jgi:hypothetical protein
MSILDLSNYRSVRSAYFVRVDVPDYDILRFSNFDRPYTLDSELYSNLGSLLSISSSQSEIRSTSHEVTVQISGVPSGSVAEVLDNPLKGSEIVISRGFFTPAGVLLALTGNPATKFKGIINNVSFSEEWDQTAKKTNFSIGLICSGSTSLLSNKVAGRRTNPLDEKFYFPTDSGFNRVPTLKNSNFQFGAPKGLTTAGNR